MSEIVSEEKRLLEYWNQYDIFNKTLESHKNMKEFAFYDGPPFMTGLPHYGHILAGSIKDTITRFQHQNMHSVPRRSGADCHGLPIEYEIDKNLGIKTTQQVKEYGIDNYNNACQDIVLRCANEWESQMGRLGRWIDFKDDYKTMDKNFMNSVWWVFKTLFEKNRVYEGVKIMSYSIACGTPLSNFETQQNYQKIDDDSLFFKVKLKHTQTQNRFNNFADVFILVWTTTPWTLPTNYCLCVNRDIKYVLLEYYNIKYICGEKLIDNIFGKNAPKVKILDMFDGSNLINLEYDPIFPYNNMVDKFIIVDDDFVSDSAGTGIVHISPTHGQDDYNVCIKKSIIFKDSTLFEILDSNGYVNSNIPEMVGSFYKNFKDKSNIDLNTWVITNLKQRELYFDKRTISHEYPFCWRSETPLIYRAVTSWFIKVEDMREQLTELNSTINWIPKSVGESRFNNWLDSAKDWGISRNRFWGTPIPIWKSDTGKIICVGSSYELEKLAGLEYGSITDMHRQYIDQIEIFFNGETYKRVEFVFDCWFESGSMPYATVGKVGIAELLEKFCTVEGTGIHSNQSNQPCVEPYIEPYIQTDFTKYRILPADFIAEGLDQTRGWFYTLLVLSASLFNMIPFKNVIVNGLILASDGKKMSKRLKNYPEPMEIVNLHGSDALRLYLLGSQATKAEPLNFSDTGVFQMNTNIILPLKSAIDFLKEYLELFKLQYPNEFIDINFLKQDKTNIINTIEPINLWILSKYKLARNAFFKWMNEYELKNGVNVLIEFVQTLNNDYIKIAKNLLKGKEGKLKMKESLTVLNYVINFILNDFKCVIPFFSDIQYLKLKDFLIEKFNSDPSIFEMSIHLVDITDNNEFVSLNSEQTLKAVDFDIINSVIRQLFKLRSLNISTLKKPVSWVGLLVDENLTSEYSNEFLNMLQIVSDECNILNLQVLNKNQLHIQKFILPIDRLFFEKYKKEAKTILSLLKSKNSEELEELINNGTYEEYLFNINIDIKVNDLDLLNSVDQHNLITDRVEYSGYKNGIVIIMDKSLTEQNDKIYYYRLVARAIQKARLHAGLHPWDKITATWSNVLNKSNGPKYDLEEPNAIEHIKKIIEIDFFKQTTEIGEVVHSETNEELGITIYLIK